MNGSVALSETARRSRRISNEAIGQLFMESRSFSACLPEDLSEQTLHETVSVDEIGTTVRQHVSGAHRVLL